MILNFENEEKAESKVEAAEVTIMKLSISMLPNPSNFPTSTAACPSKPLSLAKTPIKKNNVIQIKPMIAAAIKLFKVFFAGLINPLSVITES